LIAKSEAEEKKNRQALTNLRDVFEKQKEDIKKQNQEELERRKKEVDELKKLAQINDENNRKNYESLKTELEQKSSSSNQINQNLTNQLNQQSNSFKLLEKQLRQAKCSICSKSDFTSPVPCSFSGCDYIVCPNCVYYNKCYTCSTVHCRTHLRKCLHCKYPTCCTTGGCYRTGFFWNCGTT